MRRVGLVGLAALAFAAPASAQTPTIDHVADTLKTDAVYVHADTKIVTPDQERRLERAVDEEARGPLFIAVLPASARQEAGGTTTDVAVRLGELVGTEGVYAVVVGNQFRAVSTDLARDQAGALATRAFL
ncbi:MAG: hypothetical protein M3P42_06250, partial [Actinomycetota bacterium]|nr:hypothetical protein [Actinomycetota bacterium]